MSTIDSESNASCASTVNGVDLAKEMAAVPGMSPRQRWSLVLVCTATFMLLLDITVVSVALRSIQRDLGASLPDLQWVSAAYALVLASLLLPAATLGHRLGRRRLFLVGLIIFTGGSLACALATTAQGLVLFRALQGVGGAVLFATATPLLRAEFSGAALARALGAFGTTLGGASAVGPLVGGLLTDTLGWRAIFFVNLPIGVAVFVCGAARLRESRDPAGGRGDSVGTALIIGALTALMFALIRGNVLGWGSPVIVALFATAAVAFAGFVIYELRVRRHADGRPALVQSAQLCRYRVRRVRDLGDGHRDDHLSVAVHAEHPWLFPGPEWAALSCRCSWSPSELPS